MVSRQQWACFSCLCYKGYKGFVWNASTQQWPQVILLIHYFNTVPEVPCKVHNYACSSSTYPQCRIPAFVPIIIMLASKARKGATSAKFPHGLMLQRDRRLLVEAFSSQLPPSSDLAQGWWAGAPKLACISCASSWAVRRVISGA